MIKQSKGFVGLAVLASVLAACGVAPVQPVRTGAGVPAALAARPVGDPASFENGFSKFEMMVALKKGQTADELKAIGQKAGFSVVKYWPQISSAVIRLERFGSTTKVSDQLKSAKSIQSVQPAGQIVLEATNDPDAGKQYGMKALNVEQAWTIEPGKATTKIAIIDTGADVGHPDLKDKIVAQYNATAPGQPIKDEVGHGTHCSGIAAAAVNNGVGVIGVGGKCSLMIVKVLGSGSTEATIADGVIWAADHGANVGTMSLGLYKSSPVFERALQYALDKGMTITASAGNNNAENDPQTAPHLPSTYPGVIEVAAVDQADQKASFSNYGKTVSVAAPGVNIWSTLPTYGSQMGSNYGSASGTSMAAPHAAGLAGLVLSKHPGWSPAQVKKTLEAGAADKGAPGFDPIFGFGRLDAFATVQK